MEPDILRVQVRVPQEKVIVLGTGLDSASQSLLDKFERECNTFASISNTFDASVTHLVVSINKRGVMQQRTMKYMQAILGEY